MKEKERKKWQVVRENSVSKFRVKLVLLIKSQWLRYLECVLQKKWNKTQIGRAEWRVFSRDKKALTTSQTRFVKMD
jgi:hypothetical protein